VGQPFTGEIRMFAGNFAPVNWALCQGQIMAISENEPLFQLIGTTYGGNGQSTFALPNLQGRVPVHAGSGFIVGQLGGAETVTLTVQQIPSHSHVPQASNAPGTLLSPAGGFWASSASGAYSTSGGGVNLANNAVGLTGGSQPHENMLPYLCVNFIICLFGVFPSVG
jgi:microcystin-dependent protein